MKLKLDLIRKDDSAQPRAMLNTDHIKDLADALKDGGDLTPVDVFHDGFSYWLADGFHRHSAYHRAKRDEIPVTLHEGDLRAAVLWSITANAKHATLKLTRDEKRAGVTRLLNDTEWSQWSNREIARIAGVDEKTVRNLRPELTAENPQSDTRKGADGRIINTANIGKLKAEPPVTVEPPLVEKPAADLSDYTKPRHLITYSPPPLPDPDEPEEAEIVPDEPIEEDEPYIPPYVSNPARSVPEIKQLSNEPKPKEPVFVEVYNLLGKVRSKGHRAFIDALNSPENQYDENALENQIADVIEMLRASLKQAETERKTVTA